MLKVVKEADRRAAEGREKGGLVAGGGLPSLQGSENTAKSSRAKLPGSNPDHRARDDAAALARVSPPDPDWQVTGDAR